jgi:mRNA-degrading endonuclease toxin of MazEF toxin-antitoxin module
MKRGDVYRAVLDPRSGSEQKGRRPVVIVSDDTFNETPNWRSIIVVPCSTSGNQAARGPTCVRLASGAGGLKGDGVVLCHQLTTLDKSKLERRYGSLLPADLAAVEEGIKAALDLE